MENKDSKATQGSRVAKSSMKMAVATLTSRVLGLVREQVFAASFGVSGLTDAFTVAYRIPNLLRDLFAEGAFSSAFVPVFTEVLNRSEEEAKKLLWNLFWLLLIVTGLISLLIIIFAPQILPFVTNDLFRQDPQKVEVTILLMRLMAPFLTLVSLAALFMGALNTLKLFFIPSLAPAAYNLLMILAVVVLPPYVEKMGLNGIISMGFGVIAGGLAQCLVQVPFIFKKKMGPKKEMPNFKSNDVKKIVARVGIGTIGVAAAQINVLINTILATGTVVGAVSWLTYAFRLFQFPVGILSVSIAGSNLVHFSESLKRGDKASAVNTLKSSYLLSLFTIVPATALIFALAKESVSLVFERGAFLAFDTDQTELALRCYAIGLPFYGFYKIFSPVFFSLDKPKLPVTISLVSIVVNIVFCVLLTPVYGFSILALGTSVSIFLNCTLQAFFLTRLLGLSVGFFINLRAFKMLFAGLLCYYTTILVKQIAPILGQPSMQKILSYILAAGVGAGVYLVALFLLGERKEVRDFLNKFKKKRRKLH